ncbi:translation machinery-associated protein 16 [Podospora aff. communis PSN243]|uniref:Translation machinery-associated protein 16 n=1 Tax=Podospora aff. communis PSN243 TaxID=3040156 RepID=A0AAV9GD07_9PEZI|nr:translation machinery-associated protein 16 [Podospora aff. communis PSN243]
MAKTLEKTRKQIAKKKGGAIDALHANSRNAKRLHKAQVRDERLEKIAESRKKQDRPLLQRVSHFRDIVRENENKPLDLEAVKSKIHEYVHQHDEVFEEVKKSRRPGRPASTREDLLRMKIAALQKEQQDGFYIPDLTTEKNLQLLDRWEGEWAFLSNLDWVKIMGTGTVKPAKFPPQTN